VLTQNDYLLSLVLGVVEGLTEFLPVSSTAHLRIAEALVGIDLSNGYWKMFSIVIQLGAILCLPIYFRRRIVAFLVTFPKGIRGNRTALNHPLTLILLAFLGHRDSSVLVDQAHWQEPRKPGADGVEPDHRGHGDVGR
jgi:undecaprenyl-diphosphatase